MLLRDTKGLSSCTERAAVRPSDLSCIPSPVFCLSHCRKTIPVPHSEFLNVSTRKYDGGGRYRVLAINTDTKTICIAIVCLEYSYLNTLKNLYVAVAILSIHVI